MLTDRFRSVPRASLFDLTAILLLFAGGLAFHWDLKAWTVSLFGECHFGDSEFWWDSALRVAEGHLHNHPGQGVRPGFFVLAGLAVPVLGDSVEAFHKFLLLSFAYMCPLDAGPMPADGELLLRVEGVRQGTARETTRAAGDHPGRGGAGRSWRGRGHLGKRGRPGAGVRLRAGRPGGELGSP
jgi:hypothetical protein